MDIDEYGVDTLVEAYVALREEKRKLEKETAQHIERLERDMDVLSSALKDICKNIGADSIRTSHGTVIRTVKTKYWTNDWESMYSFIKENNAFELLEKRIHQTHMKEFLEFNPDLHPAGMNIDSEYVITVRKK